MHPRLNLLMTGSAFVLAIVLFDWLDGGIESWRPAPEPVAVQPVPKCLKVDINGTVIGECVLDETKCRVKVDLAGNIMGRSFDCPR